MLTLTIATPHNDIHVADFHLADFEVIARFIDVYIEHNKIHDGVATLFDNDNGDFYTYDFDTRSWKISAV